MAFWKEFSKRDGERVLYEVTRVLVSEQTPYQLLEVVDTVGHGRCLFLDSKIQSAEHDEFIYHESLVNPALVLHPAPRNVLIAGGGEGACLREVLRHNTVQHVTMVDLDEAAVRACREYLGAWHRGAFDDPRVRLLHTDARAYLEKAPMTWDCIIVDVTDPLAGGPSYLLFTREFYQLASSRLSDQGTIAVQAESVDLGVEEAHLAIVRTLAAVFPFVAPYRVHVPSFGESWGFALASKDRDPRHLSPAEVDAVLAARGCTDLRFYDGPTHGSIFTLPRYARQAHLAAGPIITDAEPLFVHQHAAGARAKS